MSLGHSTKRLNTASKYNWLKSLCFATCLGFVAISASAQTDTGKVIMTGIVYNKADSTPAALVNVYDKATGIGTSTAKNGSFSLKVPAGDTIVFTSIEFETKTIVARPKLSNVMFAIYLKPTNYLLPAATPFSKSGFQKEFRGMNAEDSGRLKLDLPKTEKDYGPGKGSQSPSKTLSFGGNPNKKIEKQEEQIKDFGIKNVSSDKYNKQVVMKATKLNDKQAADLMKMCYIPSEVLESGSNYDVLVAIKQCYKIYLSQHPELKK